MADAANRNPVVNLKDLSSITAKGQKQYSVGEAKTDSRRLEIASTQR
jgi:hypothetical protein